MVIEKINLSQFKLNQWYAVILFNEADIENFPISQEEWVKEKNTTLSILKESSPLSKPLAASPVNILRLKPITNPLFHIL